MVIRDEFNLITKGKKSQARTENYAENQDHGSNLCGLSYFLISSTKSLFSDHIEIFSTQAYVKIMQLVSL